MITESLQFPLPMALPGKSTYLAEINCIIKKLANRKSRDYDLITNKVIKNQPTKIINLLSYTYYNAALHIIMLSILFPNDL